MPLADGAVLSGRYKIVKFLGQGGFGCTYLAQHTFLDTRFAIKEFFPSDISLREADGTVRVVTEAKREQFDKLRQKFVKEARALEHFKNQKGIVSVIDVFEENGTAYFVMDYVEGMSVEHMLQLEGPMDEQLAVKIIRETAQALQRVHADNYLHLDIKPDNIMLDFDYHPVLIDFGVAKQYDATEGHNSSTLLGFTPGFAPLEQSNSKVGKFYPATDIYALGATLYCMLTGLTPDPASDRINYPRPLADDLPAGTSPAVARAIEAAMQIRISDRPQTVADFLAILDGDKVPAKPSKQAEPAKPARPVVNKSTPPQPPKPPKSDRKHSMMGCLSFAVGLIVVLTIVLIISKIVGGDRGGMPAVAMDTIAVDTAEVIEVLTVEDIVPNDTLPADMVKEVASKQLEKEVPVETAPDDSVVYIYEPIYEPKYEHIDKTDNIPPSSQIKEEVMVFVRAKHKPYYRAYTVNDWKSLNTQQKEALKTIGALLSTENNRFIVAPRDPWTKKQDYLFTWGEYGTDVEKLDNLNHDNISPSDDINKEAAKDLWGDTYTRRIIDFGQERGIKYPAAEQTKRWEFGGERGWYLPAVGELYLIAKYRNRLNEVFNLIGGEEISDGLYWSSTEYDSNLAWGVYMKNPHFVCHGKHDYLRVRSIVHVPFDF